MVSSLTSAFASPPEPTDGNLIINGGFESALGGWAFQPNIIANQVGSVAHAGELSFRVATVFPEEPFLQQSVPTVIGQSYEISYWLNNALSGGDYLNVSFGGQLVSGGFGVPATSGFQQFTFTLQATATSTVFRIDAWDDNGEFFLDDVSIRLASPAADTVAPVVTLVGDATITIPLYAQFDDEGATATDDVTENLVVEASGTVNTAVKGQYSIVYTATDAAGNIGTATRTVIVASSAPVAVDDAVTSTGGFTTVYPLANDLESDGDELSIVSTDNEDVVIVGRALVIPADYTGTFKYTVTDGETTAEANVEVTGQAGVQNAARFTGLLYNEDGQVVGWSAASITAKGLATTQLMVGADRAQAKFTFKLDVPSASATTALGQVTLTRLPDGSMGLTLSAAPTQVGIAAVLEPSVLQGALRPVVKTATPARYHIALAGSDRSVPGAGYLIATVKKTGTVGLSGLLPDGRPFTASTSLSDNGTIAFYTTETRGVLSSGVLGGELVKADLTQTDVTGELSWWKPEQGPGSKGLHRAGVDTFLTANGSLYTGQIPLNGPGDLTVGGSNFETAVVSSVTVTAGTPLQPLGAVLAWDNVRPKFGQFRVKVAVPGIVKPVFGNGLYLPKANRAWGYFPGTLIGGRVDLRTDGIIPQ